MREVGTLQIPNHPREEITQNEASELSKSAAQNPLFARQGLAS
jgi:hypothetical protein